MNGVVLIDKSAGCTSHDVVNSWRRLAETRRTGHLGTLDPMATGLLALVTGNATRLAQYFGRENKTYDACFALGHTSDTYDAEGVVVPTGAPIPPNIAIESALRQFEGVIEQLPPAISAKKINGVAAYKLARSGVKVDLKPVQVKIHRLQVHEIAGSSVKLTVECSAGTYIRSLAQDLGQVLGCGAILSSLRRTKIGAFDLTQAKTVDELKQLKAAGRIMEALIPAGSLLPHFPSEYVDAKTETQIRQGREFRTSPFVIPPGSPFVKALSRSGELVAIGQLIIPNIYHPSTVF
jgi:tRNA pseudouridine55 synthase